MLSEHIPIIEIDITPENFLEFQMISRVGESNALSIINIARTEAKTALKKGDNPQSAYYNAIDEAFMGPSKESSKEFIEQHRELLSLAISAAEFYENIIRTKEDDITTLERVAV